MNNELSEKILICIIDKFEIYFTSTVDDNFDFDYMGKKDNMALQEQLKKNDLVLFCTRVTAEYNGNVYGDANLVLFCARVTANYAEFYTRYKDGYLKRMIDTSLYIAKQNMEVVVKTFATQPNQVNNNE